MEAGNLDRAVVTSVTAFQLRHGFRQTSLKISFPRRAIIFVVHPPPLPGEKRSILEEIAARVSHGDGKRPFRAVEWKSVKGPPINTRVFRFRKTEGETRKKYTPIIL